MYQTLKAVRHSNDNLLGKLFTNQDDTIVSVI